MKAFYEARGEELFVGRMTQYPFPLHVHEMVELAYVLEGECAMQIDGREYVLRPGDAAIVFPLVPHSFERLEPGTRGFAAIFRPDTIAEFSAQFRTMLPEAPVLRAEALSMEARFAVDRLMQSANDAAWPSRLAYLHLLLANVMSALQLKSAGGYSDRGLAYRVVKHIYDHACEPITLESAARALGISASHLSHLFSQQFHINFRRFVNAIRVDQAKLMMNDPNQTLTAICYGCGYENMRTFRRAFVRETGMVPTQYLKKLRGQTADDDDEAADAPED